MKQLKIITTGGTIDKLYFDDASEYKIGHPVIEDLLKAFNVAFEFEVLSLLKKDSLYINDDDRELIKKVIEKSDEKHFLITHGTDSMIATARYLSDIQDKTIVLTGALTPAKFQNTDAIFNIGGAIAAVQTLDSGAWVVMNGKVWNPTHVAKNRDENRFVQV
ncbi:MAG: asparaginase domain-containing protein [Proteobacteria bacterium]|nr:asparaginase domain-containing protein [Pseudomonadota bacterium]